MAAVRRFRPGLWLTLCSLISFALLIGLGVWQLQRLDWKTTMIAERAARLEAPALTLPARIVVPEALELRRVTLTGRFLDREFHLGGRSHRGEVGFHIVMPLLLEDGRTILVDRGWVPAPLRDPARRPESRPAGPVALQAVLRSGGWKGRALFRPDNAPQDNYWIWLDLPQMAEQAALERPITALYAVALPAEGASDGLPIASAPSLEIRNDHLQYALTWFSLAVALAVIYVMLSLRREET